MKNLGIVVLLVALFTTSAACAGMIDAGNWNVVIDRVSGDPVYTNASITLMNSFGDPAKYGADLELMITGGGTLPTFNSIDFVPASGAIFEGGTQYPTPAYGIGTANVSRSVDMNGGTTGKEGLLAWFVICTTKDVADGVYTLAAIPSGVGGKYAGTHVIDGVNFEDIPMTFVSGTITVVPEPSTLVLGGFAALTLLTFRRLSGRARREG